MEIFASSIPIDIDTSYFSGLFPLLSPEKKTSIKSFSNREDALRSLTGEWLARKVISAKLNIPLEKIVIAADAKGKPVLLGGEIHFNISHSGRWVVLVVDERPAGIDVEQIRQMDVDLLIDSVFTEEEKKYILSGSGKDKTYRFFEMWTLKESLMKAIGEGLTLPLKDYAIIKDNDKIKLFSKDTNQYYFKQYYIGVDYVLAVCAKAETFPDNISFIHCKGYKT